MIGLKASCQMQKTSQPDTWMYVLASGTLGMVTKDDRLQKLDPDLWQSSQKEASNHHISSHIYMSKPAPYCFCNVLFSLLPVACTCQARLGYQIVVVVWTRQRGTWNMNVNPTGRAQLGCIQLTLSSLVTALPLQKMSINNLRMLGFSRVHEKSKLLFNG